MARGDGSFVHEQYDSLMKFLSSLDYAAWIAIVVTFLALLVLVIFLVTCSGDEVEVSGAGDTPHGERSYGGTPMVANPSNTERASTSPGRHKHGSQTFPTHYEDGSPSRYESGHTRPGRHGHGSPSRHESRHGHGSPSRHESGHTHPSHYNFGSTSRERNEYHPSTSQEFGNARQTSSTRHYDEPEVRYRTKPHRSLPSAMGPHVPEPLPPLKHGPTSSRTSPPQSGMSQRHSLPGSSHNRAYRNNHHEHHASNHHEHAKHHHEHHANHHEHHAKNHHEHHANHHEHHAKDHHEHHRKSHHEHRSNHREQQNNFLEYGSDPMEHRNSPYPHRDDHHQQRSDHREHSNNRRKHRTDEQQREDRHYRAPSSDTGDDFQQSATQFELPTEAFHSCTMEGVRSRSHAQPSSPIPDHQGAKSGVLTSTEEKSSPLFCTDIYEKCTYCAKGQPKKVCYD